MNANFSIIYTCKIYEILSDKEAKNIFKFYHASLQVLSDDIYPFAIELLKDGVKLNEYQKKFQSGGIYVFILK
uniref:Uncharacterized protein n=1 Tax=Rhizophagus irregularis (strain DAOM 181602 / DAOM 197198 / MUCL 43194) TaxID=747089 RepID=U9UTQ1_RHIID